MNLEKIILSNLIRNEDYYKRVLPYLKDEYFTDFGELHIWKAINAYGLKYGKLPQPSEIETELGIFEYNTAESYKNTVDQLAEIKKYNETNNLDWLMDKTEQFCQEKAIYNAMLASMRIIDGKDKKHTKGNIPDILSEALSISFDPDVGHDYLEDFEEQFSYYHRVDNKIRFDIAKLNEITNGGLPEKTLSVALAGVHVGKTMLMCHLAAGFMAQGADVLYITLEMSQEQIIQRIDANLLNIALEDVEKTPINDYQKRIAALKAKTNGKLIVKEYPTASASTLHFKALLDELKLKKNFRPQIVFIDYINLCASSRYSHGGAGMYEYIKAVAEELRGMAVSYKTRVFTATQVNREGFKSSEPDLTNTAESFGLPATADLMFSMMVNEQLLQQNQVLFIQLKNRLGDKNKSPKFLLGVDRSRMRFFDLINSEEGLIMPNIASVGSASSGGSFMDWMDKPIEKDKFKGITV